MNINRRFSEDADLPYDIRARYIAEAAALYKNVFVAEKDTDGKRVDRLSAVRGELCLVPEVQAKESLLTDYQRMADE